MSVMKILLFTCFSPPEIKIPKAISMSEVSIKQTGNNEVFIDYDLYYELSLRITLFNNL